MRAVGVIVVVWLVIGLFAAFQRGYLGGAENVSCARVSTVLVTVLVGPLNYVGLNPQIDCAVPQPSQ